MAEVPAVWSRPELESCPFCGAKAEVWHDYKRTWGLIDHEPGCWFVLNIPRRRQEIPGIEFESWNRRVVEYRKPTTMGELERENAKLRELVDYMTPIAWYGASEQERDRMRELGVEVKE